jgi:hypothetical protein
MALSRHAHRPDECPLLRVKRTFEDSAERVAGISLSPPTAWVFDQRVAIARSGHRSPGGASMKRGSTVVSPAWKGEVALSSGR